MPAQAGIHWSGALQGKTDGFRLRGNNREAKCPNVLGDIVSSFKFNSLPEPVPDETTKFLFFLSRTA